MIEEIVKKSRSYREFDRTYRFTKEELAEYIECIRYCPSSVNKQAFKYYLVYEEDKLQKMKDLYVFAKALKDIHLPREGKEPTGYIVICQDTRIDQNLMRFQRDIGVVSQTILLRAAERGLGGCMVGSIMAGDIHSLLELDEHIKVLFLIALGKPDEEVRVVDCLDGNTTYYRDENDIHYVPKRAKDDIILNKE